MTYRCAAAIHGSAVEALNFASEEMSAKAVCSGFSQLLRVGEVYTHNKDNDDDNNNTNNTHNNCGDDNKQQQQHEQQPKQHT